MSLATQLATAQGRIIEIGDELEALGTVAEDENRDLTDTDRDQITALNAEHEKLIGNVETLQLALAAKQKIADARLTSETLAKDAEKTRKTETLPAVAIRQKSKYFAKNQDAYLAGQWILGVVGDQSARQFCIERGYQFQNAMEGGTDTLGGYLVPAPLAATIIELLESWGVYRRYSRNVTMTSQTLRVPRLSNSLSVVYPGEGGAITPSDLEFQQETLTAVKLAQLGILSTELNEDSVISMIDLLVRDTARNFAYQEDRAGFQGDGGAGFGSQTGIESALQAGAKVTLGTAGWNNVTMANLLEMAGKIKEYPGISPVWFMHRYGYFNAIVDLLLQQGGTDMRQAEEGGQLMLLGYPVQFVQTLPGDTVGLNAMMAVLGDLDLGTYLGNRRQISIRTLTELYAANDQLGVISTMRHAINVHSVGDATEAGAIVGLFNAAA